MEIGRSQVAQSYSALQQQSSEVKVTTAVVAPHMEETAPVDNEVMSKPVDTFSAKDTPAVKGKVGGGTNLNSAFKATGSSATNSAKAVAKATVSTDDNLKDLQKPGAKLAEWLNFDQAMSVKLYNNGVGNLKAKDGFYHQATVAITAQKNALASSIAKAEAADPVDQVMLDQLKQLHNVAEGMSNLYTNLAGANSAKNDLRAQQSAQFISDIQSLQTIVNKLDPALVGEQTTESLQQSLNNLTEVALGFETIKYNDNTQTPSKILGSFVMQTFRRLQQIETGSRKRENETADISGALKTYQNDVADCCKYMVSFGNIRETVIKEGITDPEVIKGMLLDLTKKAPGLKDSVSQFAQTYAEMATAAIHNREAKDNLAAANIELAAAEKSLVDAKNNLGNSLLITSNGQMLAGFHDLFEKSSDRHGVSKDARVMQEKAAFLNEMASKLIDQYKQHSKQGGKYADAAQAEVVLAGQCLNAAEAYLKVVQNGSYGKYFQTETGKAQGQINKTRDELEVTYKGAQDVKDTFTELDEFAVRLTADQKVVEEQILNLDATVSLSELTDKVDNMIGSTVDAAYARMANSISQYTKDHKIKMSADLQQFIKEPNQFLKDHPKDAGNMREELGELLEDNPKLAEKLAQDMGSIKADFQKSRRDLEKKMVLAGLDPKVAPNSTRLDSLESRVVEGLLNKNQYLFGAMLKAAGEKNTAATNEFVKWVSGIQKNMATHMISDAKMKEAKIEAFDAFVNSKDGAKLKENLQARIKEYGPPVETECSSIYISDLGINKSMNLYIFQKGGKFYALDPITNNLYNGATKDAAMRDFASHYDELNGEVSFVNSKGDVEKFTAEKMEQSLRNDIIATGVGLVGGILLLVPEPTMATKAIGYTMVMGSGAYFLNSGVTAMIEQIRVDNFDLSRQESRDALLNTITGLLTVAGPIVQGLATGSKALGTANLMAGNTTKAARLLTTGSKLERATEILDVVGKVADTADFLNSSYGVATELYDALTDPNLSDSERNQQIFENYTLLKEMMLDLAISYAG